MKGHERGRDDPLRLASYARRPLLKGSDQTLPPDFRQTQRPGLHWPGNGTDGQRRERMR